MTICDNLILMYRGLYQYNHVLLKWRGKLWWSQALSWNPSWEVPGHRGAGPFRFPSVQPLAALRLLLRGQAGKSVPKNEGLHASDLNSKVTHCLAYFAKQMEKSMWGLFFPSFTKRYVKLLSLIPLPPTVLPEFGKRTFIWGR